MNEINCIKKDQSLIHATKNFLDVEIVGVALNFAGKDRVKRLLLAFGEITHFKGLNSCIAFCFDCNDINFCSAVW